MPTQAKGRLFRRIDGKYLLYIAKDLAEDSQWPFPLDETKKSVKVNLSFKPGERKLIVEGC